MKVFILLPFLLFTQFAQSQNVPDSVWRNSWVKSQKIIDVSLVNYRNHAVMPLYKQMQDRMLKAQTDKDNAFISANKEMWANARKVKADFASLYAAIKAARKDLLAQRGKNASSSFSIKGLSEMQTIANNVQTYCAVWGDSKAKEASAKFNKAATAMSSTGADYISLYTALQEFYELAARTEHVLANDCRKKIVKE